MNLIANKGGIEWISRGVLSDVIIQDTTDSNDETQINTNININNSLMIDYKTSLTQAFCCFAFFESKWKWEQEKKKERYISHDIFINPFLGTKNDFLEYFVRNVDQFFGLKIEQVTINLINTLLILTQSNTSGIISFLTIFLSFYLLTLCRYSYDFWQ